MSVFSKYLPKYSSDLTNISINYIFIKLSPEICIVYLEDMSVIIMVIMMNSNLIRMNTPTKSMQQSR